MVVEMKNINGFGQEPGKFCFWTWTPEKEYGVDVVMIADEIPTFDRDRGHKIVGKSFIFGRPDARCGWDARGYFKIAWWHIWRFGCKLGTFI